LRRFLKAQAGESFRFKIAFMKWMRENTAKTLADAVVEYQRLKAEEQRPGFRSKIAHNNLFNRYTRDFPADNSHLGMADVRKSWALKRDTPAEDGRHVYHPSDLDLDS
jgi:hypothetical protein